MARRLVNRNISSVAGSTPTRTNPAFVPQQRDREVWRCGAQIKQDGARLERANARGCVGRACFDRDQFQVAASLEVRLNADRNPEFPYSTRHGAALMVASLWRTGRDGRESILTIQV